ncbi:MAG: hypothetical protein SFW36_11530 [Leptolyngbyaceae cyanobacterium bins.59]|nr:hypothetical protein [Leptolyngbyaceae cyanobacterium bins.59]
MNQDNLRTLQSSLTLAGRWIGILFIILLLSSAGLGWLLKSFLVLIGLLILTPILVLVGLQWWVRSNLVQDQCPVCTYEFAGLNKTEFRCPNCNEPLSVKNGRFQRLAPPGTIDVSAIEVTAQTLDESAK